MNAGMGYHAANVQLILSLIAALSAGLDTPVFRLLNQDSAFRGYLLMQERTNEPKP